MPLKVPRFDKAAANRRIAQESIDALRRMMEDLRRRIVATWPVRTGHSKGKWEIKETTTRGATGRERAGLKVQNRTEYAGWVFRPNQNFLKTGGKRQKGYAKRMTQRLREGRLPPGGFVTSRRKRTPIAYTEHYDMVEAAGREAERVIDGVAADILNATILSDWADDSNTR